jgi:hypothetical protein
MRRPALFTKPWRRLPATCFLTSAMACSSARSATIGSKVPDAPAHSDVNVSKPFASRLRRSRCSHAAIPMLSPFHGPRPCWFRLLRLIDLLRSLPAYPPLRLLEKLRDECKVFSKETQRPQCRRPTTKGVSRSNFSYFVFRSVGRAITSPNCPICRSTHACRFLTYAEGLHASKRRGDGSTAAIKAACSRESVDAGLRKHCRAVASTPKRPSPVLGDVEVHLQNALFGP